MTIYFLMFIIIPGIIVSLTFSSIYPVAAAILYHTSNHPAEERITTALQKKSSTTNIEAELASILMDYHSEDAREVQRLINELSPFRRWQWTVKAKKHAKEADRLGRLARTRTDKLRADTELAHDVHNAERARRNHYG